MELESSVVASAPLADTSPWVGKLFEALSKAQAKIIGAKKDTANPFFKSKYADLASIWDACRGPLAENGLCVIQTTRQAGDKGVCIVTTLGHSSGEWIRGELYLPSKESTAQALGSAITYGRRYSLAAIVGVCPDDDDGNAASRPGVAKATQDLPAALAESVSKNEDFLTRAVPINAALAAATTMGMLNEAWSLANDLKKEGAPASIISDLKALASKRKAELAAAQPGGDT